MRHEKIIKRNDGSRVKITVDLDCIRENYSYHVLIETCKPRKRTWLVGYSKYKICIEESELVSVSAKEIDQALDELWQKIKPEPIK